ncbi:MAG: energy-coupling factor transporter transmembrane component T family protein [Candidatus Ranarchaeia archaeon]
MIKSGSLTRKPSLCKARLADAQRKPHVKSGLFFTISLLVFFVQHYILNLMILTLVIFLMASSKLPRHVFGLIRNVAILFSIMITVSYLFTSPFGNTVFEWNIPLLGSQLTLRITDAGITYVIISNIRFLTLELLGLMLFATTHHKDLIMGLRRLHVPYMICFILGLAYRFIPTVSLDLATIQEAQKARGLELEKLPIYQRMKSTITVTVPLLMVTLRRVELTGRALSVRAFDFQTMRNRTFYKQVELSKHHYALMALMIAVLVTTGILLFMFGWFITVPYYL